MYKRALVVVVVAVAVAVVVIARAGRIRTRHTAGQSSLNYS